MPTVGVGRFEEDRAARHMISHTMMVMPIALSVFSGGVVDRHPRLRDAFLESGGDRIAPWFDCKDRHFDDLDSYESAPKTRPSERFQRAIAGSRSPGPSTSLCRITLYGLAAPHRG